MNNEKKQYCKPLMEVVEMDHQMDLLNCSGDDCVGLRLLDSYLDEQEEGDQDQMKKEYTAPEIKVFPLEHRANLLQSSDNDKTPVIHGPIGENLVDGPDPLV